MAEYDKGRSRACRVTVMAAEAEDMPVCWICLDGPSIDRPLMHPCRCPSFVHSTCIARWQLQSAGTRREKFCDFCNCELPDWKSVLTPTLGTTAPAVMNVNFDNKTYSFHVAPGADGYRQFTEAIRRAFHLPDDSELNITFTCDEPSSGSLLTLSGPGAYDAAVHCASVSAARRSTSSPSDRGSSTGQQPALPPLPLRQQQQQEDAAAGSGDAASEDSQQPPTTPRLAADHQQQQHQQQAALPSRLSSTSSSSNSLGAAAGAATAGAGTDDPSATTRQQQQQAGGSDATHSLPAPLLSHGRTLSGASSASSSGDNTPLPSPSSSTATGAGRRLRRLSRGRQSSESQSSSGLGSSLRSLSRSRSAGSSSSAHSRNSSSNSLSEPDAASAPGCFPAGVLSSSNNLVAEAERGSMSSGSSSASGGSSASRRGAGLGRKLRDALAELLISK